MYTIFSVLILINCILLILVVLVQNPKGGGLSATFGGGNQGMGVKKTADFLEKAMPHNSLRPGAKIKTT